MLSQSKLKLHKLRVRLLKPNKFNKARFKMEKLLQDLESQVSCSICFEFLQTPKILPCFHAFCLQCLNRMAAHHAGGGKFKCPTCRATTLIPQPEGTFDSCASSFLHNRLLDLLAIKEARNTPTLCGNCGKTASDCSFCFECGTMFCSEPTLSIKSKRLKTSRSRTTRIIFKGRRFAVKSFTKTNRLCYTVKLANFPCANCAGLSTRKRIQPMK